TGPQQFGGFTLQLVFSRVANQTPWVVHFVHNFITGINTQSAANTLVLQAIADINSGRAYLNALAAINTVTQTDVFRLYAFFTGAARLAAAGIIGNDTGVRIEHHRLEAGVWAHVQADLLPQ